jgi:hypothetical protein
MFVTDIDRQFPATFHILTCPVQGLAPGKFFFFLQSARKIDDNDRTYINFALDKALLCTLLHIVPISEGTRLF